MLAQLSGLAAVAAADAVVEDLVADALAGTGRARLTRAPAGAGKTGAVVRLVGELARAGRQVGVVTQTNAQAFDVVERAAAAHPEYTVGFLNAGGVTLPPSAMRDNVCYVEPATVHEAAIIVATADKWAYARPKVLVTGRLDAGIIDEAYQMTSAKLLRIAELFDTLDLVGDPGQLDPFSTIDDEPWEGLPQNPVLNAVDALLLHHPAIPQHTLRVSRRLDWRGAPPVQQAFYPDIAFGPAAEAGSRSLRLGRPAVGSLSEAVWAQAAATGWAYVELPERRTLQVDGELVETIAELVDGLFTQTPIVVDERTAPDGRALSQERVAVGVSHRSQRAAVSIALQRRGLDRVLVDTANRLQGREFDVVVAAHPLSGRSDASAFHLDAGRLCVLASRHRQCCLFVGRAGASRLLADYPPPGRAVLRAHKDPEMDGWEAHIRFLEHLESMRISISSN